MGRRRCGLAGEGRSLGQPLKALSPSFTLLSSMKLLLSHRSEAAQPRDSGLPDFSHFMLIYLARSGATPLKAVLALARVETD